MAIANASQDCKNCCIQTLQVQFYKRPFVQRANPEKLPRVMNETRFDCNELCLFLAVVREGELVTAADSTGRRRLERCVSRLHYRTDSGLMQPLQNFLKQARIDTR